MRIMAFAAHPDDELCCAGTLAKYRDAGHAAAIVFSTNGEVGSPVLGKAEIAAIRKEEARASAAVIGAEFFWMGYPDEFLFNTPEARLHVIDVIRQFRPDIILCPDREQDYHPDHTTTGQIVWDTHVMVTVPNIVTAHPPCRSIPEIVYMDTAAGVNFTPEFYVDITDQWETKKAMVACHRSQAEWMMAQYGVTHVQFFETVSGFRGLQAGCRYAEAFRKPKFFPGAVRPSSLIP